MPAGAGVPNVDFMVFVTAEQSASCPPSGATSGVLAYASTCQRDQYDRPTFGSVNFCPFRVPSSTADQNEITLAIGTAIHELFHALGFNSDSWYVRFVCASASVSASA